MGGISLPAARQEREENTDEKTGSRVVPMPHGGAVRTGGNPGNKGGTGRPPNEIRARMREGLSAALDLVDKMMEEPDQLSPAQKLQMVDLLARYGIGAKVDVTTDEMPVKMYALTPEQHEQV
jgi:hypothetical protein